MTSTITTKKASKHHNNRQWHNWLVYNINDKYLAKHASLYQGALYDLGCGESPYQDFFLQFADSYTGVDWAESQHITKEKLCADLNKALPIESGVADTIVSLSVLEHLYNPQNMLDEAYRLLKPNGHIIVQVPWQWWIHEAPHDYFRYTPYGLKHMLSKAGFTEVNVEAQSGFFTMWSLKFNYFSTRFIRGPKMLRTLIKLCLVPFWAIGQLSAPFLDKLDRKWHAETIGYFVTAKK